MSARYSSPHRERGGDVGGLAPHRTPPPTCLPPPCRPAGARWGWGLGLAPAGWRLAIGNVMAGGGGRGRGSSKAPSTLCPLPSTLYGGEKRRTCTGVGVTGSRGGGLRLTPVSRLPCAEGVRWNRTDDQSRSACSGYRHPGSQLGAGWCYERLSPCPWYWQCWCRVPPDTDTGSTKTTTTTTATATTTTAASWWPALSWGPLGAARWGHRSDRIVESRKSKGPVV
jgi:hypothetical protein